MIMWFVHLSHTVQWNSRRNPQTQNNDLKNLSTRAHVCTFTCLFACRTINQLKILFVLLTPWDDINYDNIKKQTRKPRLNRQNWDDDFHLKPPYTTDASRFLDFIFICGIIQDDSKLVLQQFYHINIRIEKIIRYKRFSTQGYL